MTESAQSSSCPVLTGENNFTIWKFRIKAKLASAKVAGVAYGMDTRESITTAVAATAATSISAVGSSTIQPTDSWDIRDQKAHGIIVEHLSDSLVMALVADSQSAKELMDAPLTDHITRIRSLGSQLRGMIKSIDDEFTAFLLLHSLPSEEPWTTLCMSILNSIPANSKLTFADVETRITLQATSMTSAAVSTSTSALTAKPTKVAKYCEVHGDCGHSTEDCNALKAA
ncbi:hypothetical protein FISHEDRAFT_28510, partial [Fistulina hepatica ATCC 64428]